MSAATDGSDLSSLKLTVAIYLVVFLMKIAAYFATGVMALLAEGLHTLSDLFVSSFLLAAAYWSRRGADYEHAFGHERAQNVAALVAATLFISFTSFKLFEEAIPRLFAAHEATFQNLPVAIGVLLVSMVAAGVPMVKLFKQRGQGAALKAQFMELINDQLGLLAALIGTLFVLAGQALADPIAAILVAMVIAYNAVGLFRENASFLLGRSPDPDFMAKARELACSVPGVLGVHELRAEYVGPETVHAEMHVAVSPDLSVGEADRIAEEVREVLHESTRIGFSIVHVEPAGEESERREEKLRPKRRSGLRARSSS